MGYTFKVGNAVPVNDKSYFPELYASWEVESAKHPNAPAFLGDIAQHTNERSQSYSVWSDFCRNTGLYDFFYDERGNLKAGHPGCIGITNADADLVTAALDKYREKTTLPPGFEDRFNYKGPPNYDYHLARLIWLEWWMQWAVKNCETPAIQNT